MDSSKKVFFMNDNSKSEMGMRIAKAKAVAEEEYNEKLELSRASDVDVRTFLSDEEISRIISDNEFFSGRVADLTKVQRYEKAATAARWMKANSMEVVAVNIERPSKSRPNVVISMDIRRLASLHGTELKVFSAMTILADTMFISGIKDAEVRFTFGIEGVWKE